MMETAGMGISPDDEKRIKTAVESTCERCGNYRPFSLLEIHLISHQKSRSAKKDPSLCILVLCPDCHQQIHSIPVSVKEERIISQSRNFFIRKDLRKILGYRSKPYTPVGDIDLAQIYEKEFVAFPPQGSFRLSG